MTEEQAIRFMRAVVANVRRDVDTQVLSAAFNINRPIFSEKKHRVINFRQSGPNGEPACGQEFIDLVVNIAAEGHFNKITLDGSTELKVRVAPKVGLEQFLWAGGIDTGYQRGSGSADSCHAQ